MEKRVSFIHCADIHLDAPFSALGKDNLSTERRKDLKKVFGNIIDLVIEKDVDFLLIPATCTNMSMPREVLLHGLTGCSEIWAANR